MLLSTAPTTYAHLKLKDIHGFVEELTAEEDPEYHWKDNFRTARASNEARQYLLWKLAGRLRRKISAKVAEMGGNAVFGYRTHFDLVCGDRAFIIARAYGTACTVKPVVTCFSLPNTHNTYSLSPSHSSTFYLFRSF
jgi:hypothetical protein